MECFYIRRALQNMQKALTYFTVWTELSYCLLCSTWHHESPIQGETLFVSSQEAFPGFATKRRKKSMDDNTTPSQPPGSPRTNIYTKVMYALCLHKLNLWCQSDHPPGCKLCMCFLSETFGHCQGTKSTWTTHWLAIPIVCSALSGVIFCLDFGPFFFLLLFPCQVLFICCHGMSGNKITINKEKTPDKGK
jgi:hypothetical protein